jgi:hypothetical protein
MCRPLTLRRTETSRAAFRSVPLGVTALTTPVEQKVARLVAIRVVKAAERHSLVPRRAKVTSLSS